MLRERLVEVIENLAPTPIAWLAIVVGVFVHFIGFFLFKIELPGFNDFSSPEARVSFVALDESDSVRDLREQALLSDSVPLFLPSKYDYGWDLLQPSYYLDNQSSGMLQPFEREVTLSAGDILQNPSMAPKDWNPKELLGPENWENFRTLGEERVDMVTLPVRFASMEFQTEASRDVVKSFNYAENPLEVDFGNLFWRPAEVLVYVGTEGSMGAPLLQVSSGVVALDQFVIREVQRISNMRLVPEGYYRVIFGP